MAWFYYTFWGAIVSSLGAGRTWVDRVVAIWGIMNRESSDLRPWRSNPYLLASHYVLAPSTFYLVLVRLHNYHSTELLDWPRWPDQVSNPARVRQSSRPEWAQAYIGAGGFPPLRLDLVLGLILDGDLVGLPEHDVEELLPVIDSCFIVRRLSSWRRGNSSLNYVSLSD